MAADQRAQVDGLQSADRQSRRSSDSREKGSVDPPPPPRGYSKVYADANADKPEEFFDPSLYVLEWGNFSKYTLENSSKIGEGTYGAVYLARDENNKRVVVKTIKPEKEKPIKIQQEVKVLKHVLGGPNIIKVLDLVADPVVNRRMIVYEYCQNPEWVTLFQSFSEADARFYLYNLLVALDYTHSIGVIHRDVKGDNVLYDPVRRQLRLIDWGFAEFYRPGVKIEKWPGTRYYKAPELFLHYEYYDYSVDMWAYACMFASIIFRIRVLFKGAPVSSRSKESYAHLVAIANILGLEDYYRYLQRYSVKPYWFPNGTKYAKLREVSRWRKTTWKARFIHSRNQHLASDDAVDLLDKMLVWDHEERITAKEALDHPYFAELRSGGMPTGGDAAEADADMASVNTLDAEEDGDGESDDDEEGEDIEEC